MHGLDRCRLRRPNEKCSAQPKRGLVWGASQIMSKKVTAESLLHAPTAVRPAAERVMPGRIEVITGPMFSGKSEELIRRLKRA